MYLKTALRAFGSGFGCGFAGGMIYILVLTFFYPEGLDFAWLRVIGVSTALGSFETWRAFRRYQRRGEPRRDGQPCGNSPR